MSSTISAFASGTLASAASSPIFSRSRSISFTTHQHAQLYELPARGPIDVVWLGRGVGAGSLKILAGVLVHRATRPR